MQINKILRPSGWGYDTGTSLGINIDFLTISGGKLYLFDPSKAIHLFGYANFGAGVGPKISRMVKLPESALPKITIKGRDVAGSGAPMQFKSYGGIYMTEAFHGKELQASDFEGGTISFDGSIGYLMGFGGSIICAGINLALIEAVSASLGMMPGASPVIVNYAIQSAPVVILLAGETVGLIQSFNIGASLGIIRYQGQTWDDTPESPFPLLPRIAPAPFPAPPPFLQPKHHSDDFDGDGDGDDY